MSRISENVTPQSLFQAGLSRFHLANTAYPLDKSLWFPYNTRPDYSCWQNEGEPFGFYIHLPFCRSHCRFCEYVTMPRPAAGLVEAYLDALLKEQALYRSRIDFHGKTLAGFDIGGGTPTLLDDSQLARLLDGVLPFVNALAHTPDYEQSIETNVEIATSRPGLFRQLVAGGFSRISMGVQTINRKLLGDLERAYQSGYDYRQAVANLRDAGFTKLNLDVMYGLPGQTASSWEETLSCILALKPDQISLYETRYKDTALRGEQYRFKRESLLDMYDIAWQLLREAGYTGYYGTSAFDRNPAGRGLSSYLTRRTVDFIPYIGLGIGSQGMSREHLSYNFGKSEACDLASYKNAVDSGEPIEYFYRLPRREVLGKYIAIAFYLGFVNYRGLEARLGIDFCKLFEEELRFCRQQDLVYLKEGELRLTRRGYHHYHGIIPLFYSQSGGQWLVGA